MKLIPRILRKKVRLCHELLWKIEQKGMTFDHDFGYSIPLFSSLLKNIGKKKRRINYKNRDQRSCLLLYRCGNTEYTCGIKISFLVLFKDISIVILQFLTNQQRINKLLLYRSQLWLRYHVYFNRYYSNKALMINDVCSLNKRKNVGEFFNWQAQRVKANHHSTKVMKTFPKYFCVC